jgi:hypothetical protein
MTGAVIAARLAEWGIDDLPLERDLFGSADPDVIAASVDRHCRQLLGAGVAHYDFFDSSSGSVHGVTLADGREIVVKGHRSQVGVEYLRVVVAIQAALAARGYPAPRPLAGPVAVGTGQVTVEEMIRCGHRADGHDPGVRSILATGLAEFVTLAQEHRDALSAVHHPLAAPDDALYPPPHSARFDFAATAPGAEWIDALATRARAILRAVPDGKRVATHGDWRIENVCVAGGELVAVYDWDSVHVEREPIALAPAATTFSVDWAKSPGTRFPRPPEMAAFIAEYEAARSRPFNGAEQRVLSAAIVASLAYGSRCEHADRATPPDNEDCQRALLRRLGAPLLDRGLDALTDA